MCLLYMPEYLEGLGVFLNQGFGLFLVSRFRALVGIEVWDSAGFWWSRTRGV